MLCTSGFVDDVMFSHIRIYGASCVFLSGESVTAETAGPTAFAPPGCAPGRGGQVCDLTCLQFETGRRVYWAQTTSRDNDGRESVHCALCSIATAITLVCMPVAEKKLPSFFLKNSPNSPQPL